MHKKKTTHQALCYIILTNKHEFKKIFLKRLPTMMRLGYMDTLGFFTNQIKTAVGNHRTLGTFYFL